MNKALFLDNLINPKAVLADFIYKSVKDRAAQYLRDTGRSVGNMVGVKDLGDSAAAWTGGAIHGLGALGALGLGGAAFEAGRRLISGPPKRDSEQKFANLDIGVPVEEEEAKLSPDQVVKRLMAVHNAGNEELTLGNISANDPHRQEHEKQESIPVSDQVAVSPTNMSAVKIEQNDVEKSAAKREICDLLSMGISVGVI